MPFHDLHRLCNVLIYFGFLVPLTGHDSCNRPSVKRDVAKRIVDHALGVAGE